MVDDSMKTVASLMGDIANSLDSASEPGTDKQQIVVKLELVTLLDLVHRAHTQGYYAGVAIQKARQSK